MADYLPSLTILGVHLKSDGYPNVTYRVQALHACATMRVQEINYPFKAEQDNSAKSVRLLAALRTVIGALRFIYAHLNVIVRYLGTDKKGVVYLPYPAVLLLLLFSILPRFIRPQSIAVDAFISVYDTVITDRKLVRADSIVGRLIWWLENRAYGIADVVIVDTIFNAQYFNQTFPSLRTREVVPLPLSINESFFCRTEYPPHSPACHVVFLGTFVPLQGVDTIAKAAVLLENRADIRITLVGNGQTAGAVEEILSRRECSNIEWIRGWQNKDQVKAHIVGANICLGIFGDGDKAQRVWPFKNYHYMAVGRPLITGDTECARYLAVRSGSAKPFITVPCGDAFALAEAIKTLADSPESRTQLGMLGHQYYMSHLSSMAAEAHLLAILRRISR